MNFQKFVISITIFFLIEDGIDVNTISITNLSALYICFRKKKFVQEHSRHGLRVVMFHVCLLFATNKFLLIITLIFNT